MYQHSKVTSEAKAFLKANRGQLVLAAIIVGIINGFFNIVINIGSNSDDEGIMGILLIVEFISIIYSAVVTKQAK